MAFCHIQPAEMGENSACLPTPESRRGLAHAADKETGKSWHIGITHRFGNLDQAPAAAAEQLLGLVHPRLLQQTQRGGVCPVCALTRRNSVRVLT